MQPLKRLAAFPVPQMSEQAPTYRCTQKSHPGGTVETGTEQTRDAHPQVAGYNGTSGGCLLFPAGVVCGKSTIKETPVDEAQPEIILPIRNPVPPGSQTAAKADWFSIFFRIQQKKEPCKQDKPQVFLLSRISFQSV